jgi:ATP-dependent protease ClpP protease subunit
MGIMLSNNLIDESRCRDLAIYRYVAMLCSRGIGRCNAMEQASDHFSCSYSKARQAVYVVDKQTKSTKLMNPQIKIRNEVDTTTIDIEGTIGLSEAWQFDNPESRVATYERFKECVAEIADIRNSHIVVNIRSTGGDVNDALLIYEALRSTGALVTTRCYGYTASAATIVAQAASPGCREMASTALYLVHQSLCSTEGNADELQAEVEMLRQTDRRIAEVYAMHSERSVDDVLELMAANGGRGRWLSPSEALAEGLVDAVEGESEASTEQQSLVERTKVGVKALLKALGVEFKDDITPESDVNYTPHPLPADSVDGSKITFENAQSAVEPIALKPMEDPSPVERSQEPRKQAYESDVRSIKRLFN